MRARALAGLAAAATAALMGCVREAPPPPVPDHVDRVGELEIVTRTSAYRAGDTEHWGRTRSWRLRWQGRPLVIDTLGGLFGDQPQSAETVNAVYVLGRSDGAVPEVIVNVGDGNNTSAFHALRQQGGALATPLLCVSTGGDNGVRRIGGPRPDRLWQGPQFETLESGGLLMLGSRCLYDAARQRVLRVPEAPEMSVWASVPPVALSPDGRSLVRFGSVDGVQQAWRDGEAPEPVPHLLVAELEGVSNGRPTVGAAPRGRWRALRIDRDHQRYADHETDIDAAWMERHFEWRRDAQGRDRLLPRTNVAPLPWRGVFRASGGGEYKVDRARQDLRPALAALLIARFGAEPLPREGTDERYNRLRVRGETLVLHPLGLYAEPARSYFNGQPGDPKLQQALVKSIGDAFDAELASGRLDALFLRR